MRYEKDFKDFLKLLNKNKVNYCIVGAFAVGLHGKPRYTKDLDVLVEPTKENGERIIKTLIEFGFSELAKQLDSRDFEKKDNIIQLGQEPVRIDVIMSIDGCSFSEVWKNKRKSEYDGIKIYYIGFKELIKTKKSAGRPMDIIDVDNLERIRKQNGN
jgi:hypothetical protein